MSCGCKTSGDSGQSCGTKSANGCNNVNTCGNSYKLSVFDWLSNVRTSPSQSCDLVEVRFKNDRKLFFRNVNNLPLSIGSVVTVEANPGHDIGVVSLTGELVKIQMKKKRFSEAEVLKIYRIASQKDLELWHEARRREEGVKMEARKIASALRLEMKITDVEFQGDGTKATFYYTAENRVDFRQLIKEYAALFRTKIDMKQIGFRQEAAKVGGIGSCGRELCCSSWLTDFRSVNTNAARYQQLSINPQKLAGQCGKLKCCLNYELDSYMDALSDFPSSHTTLETEKGRANCIKIDVFKKKMWFSYADHPVAWFDLGTAEVKNLIKINKRGEKTPPLEELKAGNEEKVRSADLIQENSMTRFEKKGGSKNNPNNRSRKPENKNQKPENKRPYPEGEKQNAGAPGDKNSGSTRSGNLEKKPEFKNKHKANNKNFKKKFTPKNNNES